jgi:iron complex transport system substrate-binding protein
MLYGVGAGDRVVAVSHECDFPADVADKPRATCSNIDARLASGEIDAQVKQMLSAGEPLYGIDRQALERLAPDLIVTQAQCDVCAVRYDDVLGLVERCGALRDTAVLALNPQTLGDILADVQRVGDAAGASAAARDYAASLRSRIDRVHRSTAAARAVRVACIEWIEPLMLAANWMPELIRLAGGDDALSRPGHSGYSSWDEVRRYDPEVIVVMPCGFDLERTLAEAQALHSVSGWRELSAVRTDRVYAVDGNAYFNRSGPRIVDSLEILAHLLHGQLVPPPLLPAQREHAWQRIGE